MIQNIKRAQAHLSKCHAPIGVWPEGYRHEIRLTAELMLLAARIGRAVLTVKQNPKLPNWDLKSESISSNPSPNDVEPSSDLSNMTNGISSLDLLETENITVGIANLQPTFRTDIANK